MRHKYRLLASRCDPLIDAAKQGAWVSEKDYDKTMFIFVIATIVLLPLSFALSYIMINTSHVGDVGSTQPIFLATALILTVLTIGPMLLIICNEDLLRNFFSATYKRLFGKKPNATTTTRQITIAQRKLAARISDSPITPGLYSLADAAEFAVPRPTRGPEDEFAVRRPSQRHEDKIVRDRLVQSGFKEHAIQSILYPGARPSDPGVYGPRGVSTQNPTKLPAISSDVRSLTPSFRKIHRNFLDPETLVHYRLPWEYDVEDPEFMTIFRDMLKDEVEVLFQHTKVLRSRKKRKILTIQENEDFPMGKYYWVKCWSGPPVKPWSSPRRSTRSSKGKGGKIGPYTDNNLRRGEKVTSI